MFLNDAWASLPGIQAAQETFEQAFGWGQYGLRIFAAGYIDKNAVDAGNSPTWELRPGLVLGKITATGKWTNYSATATDGSQVAAAILTGSIRMQDLQGTNQDRFYGIMVGGPVQGAKLLGLDQQARQQMHTHFMFDDDYVGILNYPFKQQVAKTANYQILSTDNGTLFTNSGAGGEVDFTLPAIANGYVFGFRVYADQILKVISTEGTNMVAFNNAGASNVSFQTGGQQIGGGFLIYSDPAAGKWIVQNTSAGANTVTVA